MRRSTYWVMILNKTAKSYKRITCLNFNLKTQISTKAKLKPLKIGLLKTSLNIVCCYRVIIFKVLPKTHSN
jgi:hypothetical protein